MTTGDVVVRPMTTEDVEACMTLYATYSPNKLNLARIREAVAQYPACVALSEERIIGFCYCYRFAPDILEIANIFVGSNHRNKRVGERLLDYIVKEARSDAKAALIAVNSQLNPSHEPKASPTPFYIRNNFSVAYSNENTTIYIRSL